MANETKTEKKAEKELKKIQDQKAKKEKKAAKALEAREKRKASIEKSNERQAAKEKKRRNMTKGQKARRIFIPLCAVLVAIALALCGFFGVYDRAIAAEKTADGDRISVAEYEYYNRMYFNYYYQMSQQYEQYYGSYYGTGAGKMMTGYDYTKTPADQEFVANEEAGLTIDKKYGDNPTWADYFEQESLKEANSSTMLYKKALAEGYELTKSEQKDLDEFVESLQKNADEDSYSLDAYLRTNYGRGMSPSLLKKIYTKQTIVNRYKEDKQKELAKDITDAEIEEEFNKNAKDYTTVDIRNFTFNNTISADDKASKDDIKKANADLKKKAQAFLDAVNLSNFTQMAYDATDDKEQKELMKDDASYSSMADTNYTAVHDYVSAEAADWAFSSDRKSGDKKLFEVKDDNGIATYHVYCMENVMKRDNQYPVNVRQILFMVTDGADSDATETETGHTDAEAKKLAEDALAKWKKGKATDESFAALATKLTEDTGSKESGGLYENVTKDSNYVEPFLNWCFADGRKKGDTGIIKTDYGYHVMYLSSKSKDPAWKNTVRDALASAKFDKYIESTIKSDETKVSEHWVKVVKKRIQKAAETVITNAGLNAASGALSDASVVTAGDE
ncbi:MAG: peptidylprolyl isomerase [Acutalibacteraceae bacterium]|nr:peptidylprolyl isomerase [Clostridia bacterium]MEE1292020.1 peptidylprolyl isomerase [Acutalibacteraceae bacterium]MEE3373581.1 peptidylprolyl isomerase [Acutalibacteraceae bacterium]